MIIMVDGSVASPDCHDDRYLAHARICDRLESELAHREKRFDRGLQMRSFSYPSAKVGGWRTIAPPSDSVLNNTDSHP